MRIVTQYACIFRNVVKDPARRVSHVWIRHRPPSHHSGVFGRNQAMAEKKKLVPLEVVTGEGSANDHGTGQLQTSVNIAKVPPTPPPPPPPSPLPPFNYRYPARSASAPALSRCRVPPKGAGSSSRRSALLAWGYGISGLARGLISCASGTRSIPTPRSSIPCLDRGRGWLWYVTTEKPHSYLTRPD